MISIILIVIGILGIGVTLWMSHPKLYHDAVPEGDPWYVLHPENFESGLIQSARNWLRSLIKILLIAMIGIYRKLSEKITVKQVLKKKIRGFLYEHANQGVRNPSEFWNKVRKVPKTRSRKSAGTVISETTPPLENDELV